MKKAIVFVFSGQGSQYYHMGSTLFTNNPVFRRCMIQLDEIACTIMGESIIEEIYNPKRKKSERLDKIMFSHPAIFMVEYSLAKVFLERGISPDIVMGASLGEFASLAVAGVMRVEELLEAVLKQAELLEANCSKSGMLAIMDSTRLYEETPIIHENSQLASINFNSHFVVSGETEKLAVIENFLRGEGIFYEILPISYGFHSFLIDQAAHSYKKYILNKSYKTPKYCLASCVFGGITTEIPKDYLWDVVREEIKLPDMVRSLEKDNMCMYIDLGPSGTLAGFIKRNLTDASKSECFSIITPFDKELDNIEHVFDIVKRGRK